jgi:hypothetical protein
MIDAESFAEKLRPLLRVAQKKADERAEATLTYVLDLLEDEPTLILRAEKPAKKEPVRHKYGEYKNVLLSDAEYEKLQAEFPNDYAARIDALSAYIEAKGEKYKSHLAVIRNWARRDEKEKQKEQPQGSFDTDEFFGDALRRMYGGNTG